MTPNVAITSCSYRLFLYILLQWITTFPGRFVYSSSNIDVVIPSLFDDLQLEGTLRLPTTSSPVPGVVLIHGSGPNSRDAVMTGQLNLIFGFEIPVFAQIGDALQEAGIATLTYDKRSCGVFNGFCDNNYPLPDDDLTIDTFVNDAISAVTYLNDRSEINGVIAIGHSQSGQFIPVMLEQMPESLVGGVILAGPFRPIDEVLEYQLNATVEILTSLGVSEEVALQLPNVVDLAGMVEDLNEIKSGNTNITSTGGASADFWNSWIDIQQHALDVASNITQPVLILNGELDWTVPVEEAFAWEEYLLMEAGLEPNKVMLVTPNCVTHALNCISESNPALISPNDISMNVSSEVIDALIDFIGEVNDDGNSIAIDDPATTGRPTESPIGVDPLPMPGQDLTEAPAMGPTLLLDASSSPHLMKKWTILVISAIVTTLQPWGGITIRV